MKIISNNGQFKVTIPKELARSRLWQKSTRIRFLEGKEIMLVKWNGKRIKNGESKVIVNNNQYKLTIPKKIIEKNNWTKGTKIKFYEDIERKIIIRGI